MLDVFNFPTPQGSNYQEFYGSYPAGAGIFTTHTWAKPRGASMVRIMLIGAGGGGGNPGSTTGGAGGGSGGITSWIGPAIFIPDTLIIAVGSGGTDSVDGTATIVRVEGKAGTGYYTVLQANGGGSAQGGATIGSGANTVNNNFFGASGIYTSIGGQNGGVGGGSSSGGSVAASTTTFLSGGSGGSGGNTTNATVTPNYGYPATAASTGRVVGQDGFFITQPILVGRGGSGGGTTTAAGSAGGRGGIGCGGGGGGEDAGVGTGAKGGDGAAFIWAW